MSDTPPSAEVDDPAASPADPKERFQQAAASKQAGPEDDHEDELWEGSYSHKAMIGVWFGGAVTTLLAITIAAVSGATAGAWGYVLLGILVGWAILAGLYFYRRYSVHYRLTDQRMIHEAGLLWRTVDRVELIDVDDVTYRQGPVERALGVGTILVTSSDRTTPELSLPGIDDVREIADMIDDARRKERRSRGLHIEAV
ncbi:MAG: PH domain-containing protein [Planctomycetota bacterium]